MAALLNGRVMLSQVSLPRTRQLHGTSSVPAVVKTRNQAKFVVRAAQTISTVETETAKDEKNVDLEYDEEEHSLPGLSPQQVGSFLSVLCDETKIAEVELKMGDFTLKVRRNLDDPLAMAPVVHYAPPPVAAAPVAASPAPVADPSPLATATLDEEDIRESYVMATSPKVGVYCSHRYLKGKKVGKAPLVQVGDRVKRGQALCFIEQLGTHVLVEAPAAGEVISMMKSDSDPVEFGEVLFEISPFFGGHIIGDSKYA